MWKDWLTFSNAERYGVLVLFVLVCIVAVYPYLHKSVFVRPTPLADPKAYAEVDSFFTSLKLVEKPKKIKFSMAEEEVRPLDNPQPFKFDPNTIFPSQLVNLGFTKRQAAVIENYRLKGGVFRAPSDFKKMFVVDSLMYSKLEPYIEIPPKTEDESEKKKFAEMVKPISIELNSTDSVELTKLRGIGKGYARRIIAYRQLLGGYHDVNQLLEVYGFSKDILESIRPSIWADTLSISKININLVDYNDLKRHPYISDYQAKSIVYYRETKGNILTIKEIVDNKLVDQKTFDRIKFYITVN